MTDQEIIELIDTTLVNEFELNIDDMVPGAALKEDLGLDSLDRVDMVIVLEKAFNFKLSEEETIRAIRTLGDIHSFVIRKNRKCNKV
jgi:acyl carrier protein